jgi:hypothetical protein
MINEILVVIYCYSRWHNLYTKSRTCSNPILIKLIISIRLWGSSSIICNRTFICHNIIQEKISLHNRNMLIYLWEIKHNDICSAHSTAFRNQFSHEWSRSSKDICNELSEKFMNKSKLHCGDGLRYVLVFLKFFLHNL